MKSLMIKDLAVTEELDSKAMAAVRGGDANVFAFQSADGGFFGGTNTITNVDASTRLDLDLTNITQAFNVNPVAVKF